MKKPYVRPELYFESFELSQNIADCGWELQSADENICHAVADETKLGLPFTIFQESVSTCQLNSRNFYCYQPGTLDDALALYKS